MTYSLSIELPGLPKLPNGGHGHWRTDWAERKKWKAMVHRATCGKRPAAPLKRVRLTLTRCSTNKPDLDNLARSFKATMDGLVEAGILIDDKPSVFDALSYRWERAPRGKGSVRIELVEVRE